MPDMQFLPDMREWPSMQKVEAGYVTYQAARAGGREGRAMTP